MIADKNLNDLYFFGSLCPLLLFGKKFGGDCHFNNPEIFMKTCKQSFFTEFYIFTKSVILSFCSYKYNNYLKCSYIGGRNVLKT